MRKAAVLAVAVIGCLAASGTDPAMRIKHVGLGSGVAEVEKSMGAPKKRVTLPRDDTMGMGDLQELQYPGVLFEFCRPPGQRGFHVWRMTVTGPGIVVEPGLEVGMAAEDVRGILGDPTETSHDKSTGRDTMHYSFTAFDGSYWVELEKGKVAEIGADEDWS
jgi:hypothetical protein